MFGNTLSAIVLCVVLAHASPAASAQAAEPFRFNYTTAETATASNRAALEARLQAEAAAYCRRAETSASVVSRGCRRAVVIAAQEAMARARGGA